MFSGFPSCSSDPPEKGERQKKGGKGRKRPISRKGGQTPLKPPLDTPPFAAVQVKENERQSIKIDQTSHERHQWGQKGSFRGSFCSSPVAAGCGGIGPEKHPTEKAPICPKKARFPRKDFPRFSLKIWGLNLDFPNI